MRPYRDTALLLYCVVLLVLPSCSYRPQPVITERNYETDSTTAMVRLGVDDYKVVSYRESLESAKQRLLKEIADTCPNYRMLAEGTSTKDKVGSAPQLNTFTGDWDLAAHTYTDYYYWVRYRCDGSPSVTAYQAPTRLPSAEEASAKAFQVMSQKCGEDYALGVRAAAQLQETRLRTAGFSSETETKAAANLLIDAPMTEQTRLYLSALGISEQGERQARSDYLKMMKTSSGELRKIDEFTLQTTAMFYSAYLKQFQQITGSGLVCRQP
jgi:hypothetical protein